ncbi:hypothetical protein GCK72_022532 [Caenorhabditis remanei]|uniref:Uncharacterized protein n=2 Tax=Caenorhabditis remanei TaxID=31234 RepID=E3N4J1_CAERE|nr:hypothetical protein GCK72_022532 [Caenorhabditis remanei]EFO85578.1 hypothetical protein CRE_29104 [Caenorhabditis remanei]KAF1746080.1 hypothetical protein GCK72_022532 [Caenorhabditis remanei]
MHHAAAPFTSDCPIPVHYYANELNRFVQEIVPDATQEQMKTIESIAINVKASHEYSQQKLSSQINEFEEKMKQKEIENEELKAKLIRLEKKFEHMKMEKDLYEYNAVCNDQYENYITQLKKDFKEQMERERDNFLRTCSNASEKINELENQVAQLRINQCAVNNIDLLNERRDVSAHQRPLFVMHPDHHSSILVIVDTNETVTPCHAIDTIATTDTIVTISTTNCGPFIEE